MSTRPNNNTSSNSLEQDDVGDNIPNKHQTVLGNLQINNLSGSFDN